MGDRTATARWRLLLAGIALLLAIPGFVTADQAPPSASSALTMQVHAGFDGFYKVGGWLPISVLVANDGPALSGRLSLDASSTDLLSTTYSADASLPTHSQKLLSFAAPLLSSQRSRSVVLSAGGRAVSTVPIALSPLSSQDYLYGIISSDPGALDALRGTRQFGGSLNVAHLTLNDLPALGAALGNLDALVLDDTPTASLPTDVRRALEGWIASGGQLILAGGPGAAQTFAGLADLAPLRLTGTATLDVGAALAPWTGRLGPSPSIVATGAPLEGSIVRLQVGASPLVVDRPLGRGWVTFLALPASAPEVNGGQGALAFWQHVLTGSRHALMGTRPVVQGPATSRLNAVYALPEAMLPPGKLLGWLIFVYILTVGPLSYLLLRRLDRRELLWVTIPAVSLLFSAGAYILAHQVKGSEVIVSTVTIATSSSQSPGAALDGAVGIFSPGRTTYEVRLAGGPSVAPLDRAEGTASTGQPKVVTSGSAALLEGVRVDKWAMQAFSVVGVSAAPAPLATSLTIVGANVTGWVRNTGGQPLEDAQLIIGSDRATLPTLQPGVQQPVSLSLSSATSRPSKPPTLVRSTATPEERQRQTLLEEALDAGDGLPSWQGAAGGSSGPLVVAFSRASAFPVTINGHQAREQNLRLDVVSVPVALGPGQTSLPFGLTERELLENSGFAASPGGSILPLGSTTTFQFHLPTGVETGAWHTLRLRLVLAGGRPGVVGIAGGVPSLSLYNWTTGNWDAQANGGTAVISVSPAASYVDRRGLVRVQLRGGNGQQYLQALDLAADGTQP